MGIPMGIPMGMGMGWVWGLKFNPHGSPGSSTLPTNCCRFCPGMVVLKRGVLLPPSQNPRFPYSSSIAIPSQACIFHSPYPEIQLRGNTSAVSCHRGSELSQTDKRILVQFKPKSTHLTIKSLTIFANANSNNMMHIGVVANFTHCLSVLGGGMQKYHTFPVF